MITAPDPLSRRTLPATTWWSIGVLVFFGVYLVGLIVVFVWWLAQGAPFPASGGNFPDTDIPYQASPAGVAAFAYVILGLPVAVVSVIVAPITWVRAKPGERVWPMVMTLVSVLLAVFLVPAALFAAAIVFFDTP